MTSNRSIPTLLSLLAFGCAARTTKMPFPVPTRGDEIQAAFLEPERHVGEMVGVGGLVQDVEEGRNGEPLIRVRLQNPNDADTSMWIALLMTLEKDQIRAGEIVRVLGYLAKVDPDDATTRSVVREPLFLLGMCLVDQSHKVGLFLRDGVKQCNAWLEGANPSDLGRR